MKTKFIYVVLVALLLGSQMTLSAQNRDNKEKKQRPTQEQMMQMQTNQIVKTLMLDDATAAKFTPVYEKYLKELRECRMMNHKPRAEKAQGTSATDKKDAPRPVMTDEQIATMLRNQFAQSRKILDVREKYYNEFRKFLSPKQIQKMYNMEKHNGDKFRKEMRKRQGMKKQHDGRRHMPQGDVKK